MLKVSRYDLFSRVALMWHFIYVVPNNPQMLGDRSYSLLLSDKEVTWERAKSPTMWPVPIEGILGIGAPICRLILQEGQSGKKSGGTVL